MIYFCLFRFTLYQYQAYITSINHALVKEDVLYYEWPCIRRSVAAYMHSWWKKPHFLLCRNWISCLWQVPEESSAACTKYGCFCQWSKSENWLLSQYASSSAKFVTVFSKILRLRKKHCLLWELSEHTEQKEKNFKGYRILFKIWLWELAVLHTTNCYNGIFCLLVLCSRLIYIVWFLFRFTQWIDRLAFVGVRESAANGLWTLSFQTLYRSTQVLSYQVHYSMFWMNNSWSRHSDAVGLFFQDILSSFQTIFCRCWRLL